MLSSAMLTPLVRDGWILLKSVFVKKLLQNTCKTNFTNLKPRLHQPNESSFSIFEKTISVKSKRETMSTLKQVLQ